MLLNYVSFPDDFASSTLAQAGALVGDFSPVYQTIIVVILVLAALGVLIKLLIRN